MYKLVYIQNVYKYVCVCVLCVCVYCRCILSALGDS